MALELINPGGLPTPGSYTHAVVATGSRTILGVETLAEPAA